MSEEDTHGSAMETQGMELDAVKLNQSAAE